MENLFPAGQPPSPEEQAHCVLSLPFDFGHIRTVSSGEFEWGRHYKRYLLHCARATGLAGHRVSRRELLGAAMDACKYKNLTKFHQRRLSWNAGELPVPLAYLQFIDVSLEMLEETIALDVSEWKEALKRRPCPDRFVVRYMPAVYGSRPLPADIAEEDAIAYMQEFLAEHPGIERCFVNWPGLMEINVWSHRSPTCSYWRPGLFIKNHHVHFTYNGNREGVIRIG